MRKTLLTCAFAAFLLFPVSAADEFTAVADWLKLPEGRQNLGNMHGDVAVSSADVQTLVSVGGPGGLESV